MVRKHLTYGRKISPPPDVLDFLEFVKHWQFDDPYFRGNLICLTFFCKKCPGRYSKGLEEWWSLDGTKVEKYGKFVSILIVWKSYNLWLCDIRTFSDADASKKQKPTTVFLLDKLNIRRRMYYKGTYNCLLTLSGMGRISAE